MYFIKVRSDGGSPPEKEGEEEEEAEEAWLIGGIARVEGLGVGLLSILFD